MRVSGPLSFFVCTVAISAVMRLKAGDHVPHVFDLPTAGAFDFKGDCRSFRQQPPAVAAPNLFFNPSHSLKVLSCAPEHRLIAFARPSLWALNRRRKPCTMITASCGAVVRWSYTGPVGELVTPPPLPEHTLTVYASGVTRRNSGGDCLPSLSLS